MALSARFSRIRVTTEDKMAPEHIKVLEELQENRFKYSNPSTFAFLLDRSDKVCSEGSESEDDDANAFKMDADWKADFLVSLRKSKQHQQTGSGSTKSCLKVPFGYATSLDNITVTEFEHVDSESQYGTNQGRNNTKVGKNTNSFRVEQQVREITEEEKTLVSVKPNVETVGNAAIGLIKNGPKVSPLCTFNRPSKSTLEKHVEETHQNSKKTNRSLSAKVQLNTKKDTKKNKVYNIKPAISFPLDELLPADRTNMGKSKLSPEIEESLSVNTEKKVSSPESKQQVFHGIVYSEDSPCSADTTPNTTGVNFCKETDKRPEHPPGLLEDANLPKTLMKPAQNVMDPSLSVDLNPVKNFIEAMKYGNNVAIQKIQAALNEQIMKTRFSNAFNKPEKDISVGNFGFYKEIDKIDIADENLEEKSKEELFQLFVEQVSELVKTEEDKVKVEYLLKVLRQEGGEGLPGTEFLPTMHVETKSSPKKEKTDRSEKTENETKSDPLKEVFEGRTLLKGGVNPRHIPKTVTYRGSKSHPKDPRPLPGKTKSEVFLKMPEFFATFYSDIKNKERKIPYNAKDPRCLRMLSDEPERLKLSPHDEVEVPKSQIKIGNSVTKEVMENSVGMQQIKAVGAKLPSAANMKADICQEDQYKDHPSAIQVIIGHSVAADCDEEKLEHRYRKSVLQDVTYTETVGENCMKTSIRGQDKKPVHEIRKSFDQKKGPAAKMNNIEVQGDKMDAKPLVKTDGLKGSVNKVIFCPVKAENNKKPRHKQGADVSDTTTERTMKRPAETVSKSEVKNRSGESNGHDNRSRSRTPDFINSKQDLDVYSAGHTLDHHKSLSRSSADCTESFVRKHYPSFTSDAGTESFNREYVRRGAADVRSRSRESSSDGLLSQHRQHHSLQSGRISPAISTVDLRHSLSTKNRKRPCNSKESSSDIEDKKIRHPQQYGQQSFSITTESKVDGHGQTKTSSPLSNTTIWTPSYNNHKETSSVGGDEMDLSDEDIKQEFRMKFTKPAASQSDSGGLFSSLPRRPYRPGGAKTAKDLQQVEEDRKFLEDFKKKMFQSSNKAELNQSKLVTTNVSVTSQCKKAENICTKGILSYSDMINLADLEEDSKK